MNQSSMFNHTLSSPEGEVLAERSWQKVMQRLLHFVLSRNEQGRIGIVVLLLAVLFLFPLTVLPSLFTFQLSPVVTFAAWFIFGMFCVWVGAGLQHILHPERRAYQQIIETTGQLVREISDQEVLLDRMTHTLYENLGLESLSVWRYQAEESVLLLSRFEGLKAVGDRLDSGDWAELPLDIDEQQLHGTQSVSALPESALREALVAIGVRVVTSLTLGDELIGIIGLGNSIGDTQHSEEALHWLDLVTGHLALVIKSAYLITDLEETLNKLQLAYRRTVEVEEEERRHLAVELHDDVLSRLTTMSLTLRNSRNRLASDPAQVHDWLEMLEKETRSLNRRLREITQGLHPSVLVDLGLISALQAYIDSLARRSPWPESTPCEVTLTAQGFNGNRLVEQNLERDLYYITRQALDNALAHAHPDRVFIHLRWREQAVSLTVQDTGCGMKATPKELMGQNGHLGLLSMNERVLARQGQLSFHTQPGQGTSVHVRLPIDRPSPAPTHLQAFSQIIQQQQTAEV
jgi:signal transduction histidine kinase